MGKAAINPLVITRHNGLIRVTSDLAHIACTFITLVTTGHHRDGGLIFGGNTPYPHQLQYWITRLLQRMGHQWWSWTWTFDQNVGLCLKTSSEKERVYKNSFEEISEMFDPSWDCVVICSECVYGFVSERYSIVTVGTNHKNMSFNASISQISYH